MFFTGKIQRFFKLRVIFWDEISALGVFLNFDNERMYEIVADQNHFLIPWMTSNTINDYNNNNNNKSNNYNDENNSKYKMMIIT